MSYARAPRGPLRHYPYAYAAMGATDLGIDPGAGIGAQAVRIDRDWHPTGYYTPQDVIGIVAQLMKVGVKVREPLARFVKDMPPPAYWATRSRSELDKVDQTNLRAQQYSAISVTAIAQGKKYMDAPGLKAMVVGYLKRMSLALSNLREMVEEWQAAARSLAEAAGTAINPLASAMVSTMVSLATTIAPVVSKVADAIMKVAGVAYDVVKAVGNAVMKIPDTVGTIFTVLKWGAILYGGIFLYKELRPSRGGA